MLRPALNHKANKIQTKKQRSQQPRAVRNGKENSASPVYKQIHINKENMHPNAEAHQHLEPVSTQEYKYRETYFQLKQQALDMKMKMKQSGNGQVGNGKMGISRPPREIEIKITNRSLEKCQVHPDPQRSPKAQFLLSCTSHGIHNHPSPNLSHKLSHNHKNNHNSDHEYEYVLCCQPCSRSLNSNSHNSNITSINIGNNMSNSNNTRLLSIDKIANTQIAPRLHIRQYFNRLQQKIDNLQTITNNLSSQQKQFRKMSATQARKLRAHYNSIFQVIQASMKKAENNLMKYVNQGQNILRTTKQQLQKELQATKEQLRKLLDFQYKQFHFQYGHQKQYTLFDVQKNLKNYQSIIQLPIFHIHTEIADGRQKFEQFFTNNFSVQILTQKQLESIQRASLEINIKNDKHIGQQSSYQSHNKHSTQRENESDLFCDESLGESKGNNRTHQFSFQKSCESEIQASKNNFCILELVEEEDVISPVFKVI